jgi:hypothetical protein
MMEIGILRRYRGSSRHGVSGGAGNRAEEGVARLDGISAVLGVLLAPGIAARMSEKPGASGRSIQIVHPDHL